MRHAIAALAHAGATLLLWRLVTALVPCWHAAAAACLAFLLAPLHYEVALWPAAMSIALACACYLGMALLWVGFAEGRRGAGAVLGMGLLGLAIPCWNEQPAGGVLALPLLYWAVHPRDEPARRAWRRCAAATASCALGVLVYLAALLATAPTGERGSASSLTPLAELPATAAQLAGFVASGLAGRRLLETALGAIFHGLDAFAAPAGWAWAVALVAAGALWLRVWLSRPLATAMPSSAPSAGRVLLFAVALVVASWLPVLLVQPLFVSDRYFYAPALGWSVVLALLLRHALLATRGPRAAVLRAAAGCAVLLLAVAAVVAQVGFQRALRERFAADGAIASQLRDLVPRPPPYTVFVPLRARDVPVRSDFARFEGLFPGALAAPWSAGALLRDAYHRRDLDATYEHPWSPRSLVRLARDGVSYTDFPIFWEHPEDPAGGRRIPWDRVLPFVVERDGRVRLVRSLRAGASGHAATFQVTLPLVAPVAASRPEATTDFELPREPPD